MILEITCFTCRYWLIQPKIINSDGLGVGQCRKRAPTVIQAEDYRCHATFPLMREGEWCGDYAALESEDC